MKLVAVGRFRRISAVFLLAALLPLGAAAILSRFGGHHWTLDLFSHFQQQYALGLAAVTAAALGTRHFRIACVAAAVLLLPLGAVSYYLPPRAFGDAPGVPSLRILSFNVLRSNPRHAEVLAWILEQDADVVVLLEIDPGWSNALEPLESVYPHRTSRVRNDAFGVAIYSKFPLQRERIAMSGPDTVPCVQADITWPAATFRLYAMHPVPPVSRRTADNRNAYLRQLVPSIANEEGAVVAAGDFNCSPWSSHFRSFLRESGLVDSGRKRGFQSTWHRGNPLFSIPIDHVLHSPHFTCTARAIGPPLGSDHRAVTVTLALTDPPVPGPRPAPARQAPSPRRPPPLQRESLQPAVPPETPRPRRVRRVPTE